MASGTQPQKSTLPLIMFLLILLVLGIFLLLPSYNTRVNTSTQSTTQNQCPQNGQSFDTQQEAFTLAQSAEQYRRVHSFGGNYGLGSYIICFTDGTQQQEQSKPFEGFYSTELPKPLQHITHSEQHTYDWLQEQLSLLSIDQSQVTAIYAVNFSQVAVCVPCQQDMIYWQRSLRQKVKTDKLYLSIWDIIRGKGFAPVTNRAGTGTPVAITDLRQVPILFVL